MNSAAHMIGFWCKPFESKSIPAESDLHIERDDPMRMIPAKTIISGYSDKNQWFGTHYNMNIYKGCSHGCIYCDSRSQCYGVENFDEVRAKENALMLIEKELRGKRRTGIVGTGAMSDPYNPMEKDYELTRGALKLIHRYRYGISIATKSSLVVRDMDLLTAISSHSPVLVMVTVTTGDDELARKVEPNVALPSERFGAIKALSEQGIHTGILMMPILPFIEDNPENIAGIVDKAYESGARYVYPAFGVTLRQNQRDWFFNKLDVQFPGLKQMYIRQYGEAYSCTSPHAKDLWKLVEKRCGTYGMACRMKDIIRGYTGEYGSQQLSFL